MRALLLVAILALAASCAPTEKPAGRSHAKVELCDGQTPSGWRALEFEPGTRSALSVAADGSLLLGAGEPLAGMVLDRPGLQLPAGDYEIGLEAKIVDGGDFFCGLTFPVPSQGRCATLIVGGWGGTVVGISSVNGMDASMNTTRYDRTFEARRWYEIRARITSRYIDVWIDGEQVVELDISKREIAMRPGAIEACQPIGLATWRTAAAYRKIWLREL